MLNWDSFLIVLLPTLYVVCQFATPFFDKQKKETQNWLCCMELQGKSDLN